MKGLLILDYCNFWGVYSWKKGVYYLYNIYHIILNLFKLKKYIIKNNI